MKNLFFKSLLALMILLAAVLAAGCGGDDDDDDGAPAADDDSAGDDSIDDDADDDMDDDADDDADDTGDDNADDTADDDTTPVCDWSAYNPLIEAGKAALSADDPAAAQAPFDAALALCPSVGDAQMGKMLADLQILIQSVSPLLGLLATFPNVDWVGLQANIRDQLLPLNAPLLADAMAIAADYPETRFYVSPLPLWMDGEHVVIDAGGEWDMADALNAAAIAGLADGVERFLLSFNLDANWALATLPGGYDPVQIAHEMAGNILQMFADPDHPDFLKFLPDGQTDFAQGAISLGFACMDGAEGFASVRAETDAQEDDVTAYVDENGNGQWDEGEPYRMPYLGVLSTTQNKLIADALIMMDDLGPALLDSGPRDPNPLWPNWLPLDDLNFILAMLSSYVPGLTLPAIPVPVGYWFYNPPADGVRSVAQTLVQALYDLTAP